MVSSIGLSPFVQKTIKLIIKNKSPLWLISLILFVGVANLSVLREGHGWGDDFAMYLSQMKSLKEGSLSSLMEKQIFLQKNNSFVMGPTWYPWGYPIILMPIYELFGMDIKAFKIFTFLFFIAVLPILFVFFKTYLNQNQSLLAVSLVGLNTCFWQQKEIVADYPALFFIFLTLIALQKFINDSHKHDLSVSFSFTLGLLIFLCTFMRSQGLSVLFTFIASILFYKAPTKIHFKYKLIVFCTFVLCSFLAHLIFPNDYYSGTFKWINYFKVIHRNSSYYLETIMEFFYYDFVGWLAFIFIALGMFRFGRQSVLNTLFLCVNICILLVFPYKQGIRFLLPIFPILILFLIKGIESLKSYLRLDTVFSLGLLLLCLVKDFEYIDRNKTLKNTPIKGAFTQETAQLFDFINNKTDQQDTINFFKPRLLRFMTNRTTYCDENLESLSKKKNHILVIDDSVGWKNQISSNSDRQIDTTFLALMYRSPQFSAYLIR